MANRLHRYYGAGYLHFITTSCYQRRALLGSRKNRDLFLKVLEQVRRRYRCGTLPSSLDLSGSAASTTLWFSARRSELRSWISMHRNPVKRGWVLEPEQWAWSSFRHYADGERGLVLMNEGQRAEMKLRKIA
jgi:putative transposase